MEKSREDRQDMTIEEYLQKVATFVDNQFGQMIREQFKDINGSSELGMLACPTKKELAELKKAVAIMTKNEKQNACNLSDEQIQRIAFDAGVDPANLAIFMNGYALSCKRDSCPQQ
ncbi:MAG: hypothetical protein WDA68_00070 [Phycisphaerae bacterium]